jgi:hypothetical protein
LSHGIQEVSTPTSLIDAQIAAVARQAAHEANSPPVLSRPAGPRRPFASYRTLLITWALSLGLTLVNLESGGLFTPRPKTPDPAELVAGLETSAAMDAVLIAQHLSAYGVLPLSLATVGLPDDDPTLEYQRIDGQAYRVIARYGEFEGVFDSRAQARRRAHAAERRADDLRLREAAKQAWAADAEMWLADAEDWVAEQRGQARGPAGRESGP